MRKAGSLLDRLAAGTVALAALAVTAVALFAEAGPVRVSVVSPGDGAALTGPPGEVTVTFSRPFEATETHLTVANRTGQTVSCGDAGTDGPSLRVPVRIENAGNYLVAYHVKLADGKELSGITGFTVGNGQTGQQSRCQQTESAHLHHGGTDPLSVAFTIVAVLAIVVLLALLVWRRLPGKA